MNKKYIFFTALLFITLLTASMLAFKAAKNITTARVTNPNNPDFFMTNTFYTKFDNDGNISEQIHMDKIMHFTTRNNYIFDNPRIKMNNQNEVPWHITANKGKSEFGKSKIYLWDNVKLIQAIDPKENPIFDISTNSLFIYTNNKSAQTSDPITIIQSGSIAKAVGAKADFKSGTVKLLSNVECQYQDK
jgi:LPS export ABC transporter protein LptC